MRRTRSKAEGAPSLALRIFCASTASSIAEASTLPFDAVATRLQLGKQYSGPIKVIRHIITKEHISIFWRGLAPAIGRQAISSGFGVGFYPIIRRNIRKLDAAGPDGETTKIWHRILSGAVTGGFAQCLASPFDVIKVRMQSQAKAVADGLHVESYYTSVSNAFVTIVKNEGVPGLFIGLPPSIFRSSCQFGVGLSTYDSSKHYLLSYGFCDTVGTHFICSAISGLATAIAGNPADVIKTRMIGQLHGSNESIYSGTFDCLYKTVKGEGFGALYKGLGPNYCRLAPWQMVFFVCFEQISLLVTGQTFNTT